MTAGRGPQIYDERHYAIWWNSASTYVRLEVFKYAQFVTTEDLRYGEFLQKIVCKRLGVPESAGERFWEDHAMSRVKQQIRKKRNTITLVVRRRFQSE